MPDRMVELAERVGAALAKMTQGPFDAGHGSDLLRAIRGDLAVPLFEARDVYGDPNLPAPGLRKDGGGWHWRKNSHDARHSAGVAQAHRNTAALAEILNALPALLEAARAHQDQSQ